MVRVALLLMIFGHHADEGGTTVIWRETGMVGHRNDELTCGNGSVSTSEDMRAAKERESRVRFELEESSVDWAILVETFRRSRAGSPMRGLRRERISEAGFRERRGRVFLQTDMRGSRCPGKTQNSP